MADTGQRPQLIHRVIMLSLQDFVDSVTRKDSFQAPRQPGLSVQGTVEFYQVSWNRICEAADLRPKSSPRKFLQSLLYVHQFRPRNRVSTPGHKSTYSLLVNFDFARKQT